MATIHKMPRRRPPKKVATNETATTCTVALHGEDWCHLCGRRHDDNLDIWGSHVSYTRLCYECLHRMYYMLRQQVKAREKQENEAWLEEMERTNGWPGRP